MDFLKSLLANGTDALSTLELNNLPDLNTLFNSPSSTSSYQTYVTTYLRSVVSFYLPQNLSSYLSSASLQNLSSAGLPTILALLVSIYFSFRVLDYLRRLVIFWVVLAIKVVLLLCVVQVGVYYYTVGMERSLQDAGRVWGWVEGFVNEAGGQRQSGKRRG